MLAPEFRCPTTPLAPSSTSFWATTVAVLGSAWSSSTWSANWTGLPPRVGLVALMASTASRAPFSMSLPRWAWGPVRGATHADLDASRRRPPPKVADASITAINSLDLMPWLRKCLD